MSAKLEEMVTGLDKIEHKDSFKETFKSLDPVDIRIIALRLSFNTENYPEIETPPQHGMDNNLPSNCEYIGCWNKWHTSNGEYIDEHCLEFFKSANGEYFLIDQQTHGESLDKTYTQQVLLQITKPL